MGCPVLQIFTKSPNSWKERHPAGREIALFKQVREKAGITTILSHTAYLINLASPDARTQAASCRALAEELRRSAALGIEYVVMHPGAHKQSGVQAGIQRIVSSLEGIFAEIPEAPMLLFETTAGQGSGLGHTFEQLAALLSPLSGRFPVGICLDTAHVFAAGYDLRDAASYRQTWEAFDTVIGMEHLHAIHLNDSKKPFRARVDRHEHIGLGHLGLPAFRLIMNDPRLADIPKILETPKGAGGENLDRVNLDRLLALLEHAPDKG